ncbi:filamentous hemagglutinin family protein [Microbacteriaceae bacterium K1510]|nr:filamentous hemagglutinin family protein [Microbacteriaceae bacterium K1510]
MPVRAPKFSATAARGRMRHAALLAGVSAFAVMAATPATMARPLGYSSSASASAAVAAAAASQAAQAQAAQVASQVQNSLKRATLAIQAQQATQQAARDAARAAASNVTDGLSAGGLVVDPRVAAGDNSLWQNISQPNQTTSGGQTTVTLTQSAQRAIATWQQFNVGKNTTVYFDQRGGNSDTGNAWVVLNRIDAAGSPSQIQGQIKAEGTVLLINPNGIIFNGSSQINVHTLIAAAMDLNSFSATANGAFKASGNAYVPITVSGLTQTAPNGTLILAPSDEANANSQFLSKGLFSNAAFNVVNNGSTITTGNTALFAAASVPGQSNIGVRVEAGASISTDVSGFDNGGFVALLGPQVSNAGSIATAAGQIVLAAGSSVQLAEPAANTNQTSNIVRTGAGVSGGSLLYTPPAVSGGSLVLNDTTGVLISRRGNITLMGDAVDQFGIVEATTSITRAGSITIAANGTNTAGQVLLGPQSLTTILPEENGETIPSDATSLANFVGPRIDVAAPYVDFQSGSWVLAPSATMAVTGPGQSSPDNSPLPPTGRVLLESGSTIDLSGLTATRSVSDYLYTFKVTANDVADTPLARSLIGQTVTINLALTGTRADGETWVGSPLFASSGADYLKNIAQGIDQLLTKGGTLSFGSGVSVGNGVGTVGFVDVLQAKGAVVNVSGGLIQYTGGIIRTSQVLGADGRRYDIGSANPFIAYVGVGNGFTRGNAHWGVSQTWSNPLTKGGYYQPSYANGVSAGNLSITAVNPILEGDIEGDILIGTHQRALAQSGTGTNGAQATPDQLPQGAALSISLLAKGISQGDLHDAVVLEASTPDVLGSDFSLFSSLVLPTVTSGTRTSTTTSVIAYSTDKLSSFGLGSITISGADTLTVAAGASLSVLNGGSIKIGSVSTVNGTLTAHGGSITLSGAQAMVGTTTLPNLVLGADAYLDVSGRWVNDSVSVASGFTGALFINGGSISLATNNLSSTDGTTDLSPSIILSAGSVIDVSSGGYVAPNGKMATGTNGLPKGKGGNLSLSTDAATWLDPRAVSDGRSSVPVYAPPTATNANVVMNGTIYAGGLSQGGTFALQVPAIVIDGQAAQVTSITAGPQAGTVVLPTSFFTDTGFGAFKLTSTYGSTTVTAGTTVVLKQQNLSITPSTGLPATGARLRDVATLGYALDGLRHAVDLTLTQSAYAYGVAGDRSATAQLLIDQGARILGDPQANITLSAGGPAVVLGSIVAPGGSIGISEGFKPNSALTHDGLPQYIWIGADAVLDVSGTYVPNPLVTTYSTGKVIDGGSITLSSGSVIVALAGSAFDISGASGTVEVPVNGTGLHGSSTAQQPLWSNGGSLTLSTGTTTGTGWYQSVYFAGTIKAAGGAADAAGGTLNISNLGGILVSQSGNVAAAFGQTVPATRTRLLGMLPTTTATSFIAADTINNSGLDTVSFAGPLYFAGNVDLKVPGSILINNGTTGTSATTLLPVGTINTTYRVPACTPVASCIPTIGHTNVTLEAGYIRFAGDISGVSSTVLPTLADGTLTLKGTQGIDLVGSPAVRNAGAVNLVSSGDVRLTGTYNVSTTNGVTSDGYGGIPFLGAFLVADNLTITAREIYPITGSAYLLMSLGLAPSGASGTHNTITFAANDAAPPPATPLSAGGALLVDAKTIVQGGALYAPLGTIQLGFGTGQSLPGAFTVYGSGTDPYDPMEQGSGIVGLFGRRITTVATNSVTLLPGSLTSVSAAGMMIPYGSMTDGTNWTFNNTVLNGPSAKLIVLGGNTVDTQAGAVIDGSGGGDVYATEYVPGTGGSRNVLTTTTQTVYALVPGYSSSLAPSDPTFSTSVAAGQTVTIAGGNGIPAGTYTLLPAEYATLPGAYRVVVVSTNVNPQTKTVTAPDGSVYLTGTLGNAINGASSSQTALLQIQSNAVWTKYTEIDIAKGNGYFSALAAANGAAAPRLAADAARMVVAAATSLALNATNRFTPDTDGLGGQLDITGTNLVVAASDQLGNFGTVTNGAFTPNATYTGYLFVDADMLSKLGIESTLIGGYRSNSTEGTRITATAANVEIATDAAHALTGPELMFTSLAPTSANASIRGVVVDAGSVIAAKGAVSGNATAALVFGADPVAQYDGLGALTGYTAGISGDGSLLRISNGGLIDVVRHFVPGVYQIPSGTPAPTGPVSTVAFGNLTIGAGATLAGNTLTLDSSGTTTVPVSAKLLATNYDLSGSTVNLGGGSGGLVISPDLIGNFAGADVVRLRSGSVFNLYGSNSFGNAGNPIGKLILDGAGLYSDGGTTTIAAKNIGLTNSQTTANTNGANTSGAGGSLILTASDTLSFGVRTKTLFGFATVTGSAGRQVLFTGKGSLDAKAANVAMSAPVFLVAAATSQSFATTGAVRLDQTGTVPDLDPTVIGGSLALKGVSVDVTGTIAALGGTITLEATTGALTLSDNARVTAAGTRIAIGDLIQDTPAGSIHLYADAGNVNLGAGTTVDVSAAGSGYAGTLSIYAGGTATLAGALKGSARYSDLGGGFALIANQLAGGLPLGAGFTRSFEVSLGQGDIVIGTGQTLKSEKVLLVANTGDVFVDGTIDASAASGGMIGLYGAGSSTAAAGSAGASGVTIGANARLYARYQAADPNSPAYANGASTLVQRGGTITLGTTGTPDGTLNATYGYQNVSGSGAITVASGAIFDVSGGLGDGTTNIDTTGGSVIVRAPILTNNAINVRFNGTVVTNAKANGAASGDPLVLNAFAVWSTTDASTDPNKHFDGIIDPAGFFDNTGTRIVFDDGTGLYPTSTAGAPAAGAYTPHVNFYQTTLLNFVNNPFDTTTVTASFAGAQLQVGGNAATALPASNLDLRPEIDLVNPSTSINSGNIIVASNWNFGAGSVDASGNINLLYRTSNGSEPGTLTLRAVNNVNINATISDGFFTTYASGNNSPPPSDLIANNPAFYDEGGTAYYNTTSSADLMTAAVSGKGSFSYDFVGGAQFNADGTSSVNPNAVVPLSSLSASVTGNVTIDGHTSYMNPLTYYLTAIVVPTLVRTGTGSIIISAANDFALVDTLRPGAVYTAGYVADNASGFTVPTLPNAPDHSGVLTTPVWARGGGNIVVRAGHDIVGIETPVDDGTQYSYDGSSAGVSTGQFWSQWYYVAGNSTGSSTAPFDPSAGGVQYSSWINYGTFFQGFGALGGGNITLKAGHNVKDVSASLPETIQVSGGQSANGPAATAHYYGGGNLLVEAGNDVLSGVYYVGRGTGLIRAGGSVVSDATLQKSNYDSGDTPTIFDYSGQPTAQFSVPLMLAVQDGYIGVQAAGSIDLGGIYQPTRIRFDLFNNVYLYATYSPGDAAVTLPAAMGAFFDSYGPNSGVSLSSLSGSITVNSLATSPATGDSDTDTLFAHTSASFWGRDTYGPSLIASNLSVTALTGNIQLANGSPYDSYQLYPSTTGELSLVAAGSIFGSAAKGSVTFGASLTLADAASLPFGWVSMLGSQPTVLSAPLHAGDDMPVLIYAGEDIDGGSYTLTKAARLWAGRDIVNVAFTGQNNADSDITSIVAGRDISAQVNAASPNTKMTTSFTLYGPGNLLVEAGRNLGPFFAASPAFFTQNPSQNGGGGIFAIGDGANSGSTSLPPKSYLPVAGADVTLRYGVSGGIDYASAIAKYGDVTVANASGMDFVSSVVPQIEQLVDKLIIDKAKAAGIANPSVNVTLTPAEAAQVFTALSSANINGTLTALAAKAGFNLAFNLRPAEFVNLLQQQQALKIEVDRGFLGLLAQVGLDYKNASSQYAGKYARAYEAIATLFPAALGYTDNSGGGTGAVPTKVRTGDLRMARSLIETQTGGDINILGPGGKLYVGSNSADKLTPAQQGILTLSGGSIRTYTDDSVLIYQSRVFTEQGGNIEMFSANGDLNAGKGPKSSAAYPPLRLICDEDGYCRVNPSGLVTGAGIGALISVPGQDPTKSNVVLTAPHGTIDAGAAGIRVAGDAIFNALQILNAFNIQVNGAAIGLPTVASPNIGALTTASNAAGVAAQSTTAPQTDAAKQPSIIIVEVLGFGGGAGEDERPTEGQRSSQRSQLNYDSDSPVRILGNGPMSAEQTRSLTEEEKTLLIEGERRKF